MAFEVNFDGLVGPTHNYAGLADGNTHSIKNKNKPSNPQEAALQGLDKMKKMHNMGYKQCVFPPQERPLLNTYNDYENIVVNSSASSMWAANSATVAPSTDTNNKKLNLLVANLNHSPHRRIEAPGTFAILNKIFSDTSKFKVCDYIKSDNDKLNDEGAANHTRFCTSHNDVGLHLFVYGRCEGAWTLPKKFPARQTYEASIHVAKNLGLKTAVFAQQSPESIDAGVFHHDVIGVGNKDLYFYHEKALLDEAEVVAELQDKFNGSLNFLCVKQNEIPLDVAVETYLFNSQLVDYEDGHMLVCPISCKHNKKVNSYLKNIIGSIIKKVVYVNLSQSLWNGGGPACLRLRVPMSELEYKSIHTEVIYTPELDIKLRNWIKKYYVTNLIYDDLMLPSFIQRCRESLNELTNIMNLGDLYLFQKK